MVSFRDVVGFGTAAASGGNAAAPLTRTVRAMSTSRRRLDQRSLLPRDYLADPHLFGRNHHPGWVLPPGGDLVSQRVAQVQHFLATEVRERGSRGTARVVTTRFAFSKQYWSVCLLGKAWMGETVLAAAVFAEQTARSSQGDDAVED